MRLANLMRAVLGALCVVGALPMPDCSAQAQRLPFDLAARRFTATPRVSGSTLSAFLLPIGGQYQGNITFLGCDGSNYTFTANNLPAGIVSETFSTPTDNGDGEIQTNQTITASNSAQPGNYAWIDTVTDSSGNDCGGTFPDGVSIVPGVKIVQPPAAPALNQSNPNYVFWFGGNKLETPTPYYPTVAQLILPDDTPPTNHQYVALPSCALPPQPCNIGPWVWTISPISSGTNKLEFWDPENAVSLGESIITYQTTVTVHSISPSRHQGDVTIMVYSALGATYPPFRMTVYTPGTGTPTPPYHMDDLYTCLDLPVGFCDPIISLGWISKIYYRINNQFGTLLSFKTRNTKLTQVSAVPLNENWTSTYIAPSPPGKPPSNWPTGEQCGATHQCGLQFPEQWYDLMIVGDFGPVNDKLTCSHLDYDGAGLVPEVIWPQHPLCPSTAIAQKHLNGGFWVGSGTPGAGVKVQSNTWLDYIDHGRHIWSKP